MDDVQKLAQAYQELAAAYEQQSSDLDAARRDSVAQSKTLAEVRQELEIKTEALQRQSEDLKQIEAELVWTVAALQAAGRDGAGRRRGAKPGGTDLAAAI